MKTYKTWEVIKLLGENPGLRFKSKVSSSVHAEVPENGNIVWDGKRNLRIELTREVLNYEWELVYEPPVTFIEAINSGKRIKATNFNGGYLTVYQLMEVLYGLDEDKVLDYINGKWYIESEQENADQSR